MKRYSALILILLVTAGMLFFIFRVQTNPGNLSRIVTPLGKVIRKNNPTPSITKQGNILSIDNFFNYVDPAEVSERKNDPEVYTIIATGDVIPARSVNSKMVQLHNFSYPFEKTVNYLRSADAVFINLESPLIPDCKTTLEGMIFCGDQQFINGLRYAGVTVANVANNHMGNYGIDGITGTVNLLKQNNLKVTGNGEFAVITIRDKKFGFVGYNDIGGKEAGIAWADIPGIIEDIQNLKQRVDFIIVTFHWGVEYVLVPGSRQRELAYTAIDAGADLVIGNHPHWVQGAEQYNGKIITYAHGNYIFDQMWSQETREGVLGKYTFTASGLSKVEFVPVIIEDYSQPRFATQTEAMKILERMKESSQHLMSLSENNFNRN